MPKKHLGIVCFRECNKKHHILTYTDAIKGSITGVEQQVINVNFVNKRHQLQKFAIIVLIWSNCFDFCIWWYLFTKFWFIIYHEQRWMKTLRSNINSCFRSKSETRFYVRRKQRIRLEVENYLYMFKMIPIKVLIYFFAY